MRFWAVAEQEAKSHAVSMLLNRATGPVGLMREGQNIYFGGVGKVRDFTKYF